MAKKKAKSVSRQTYETLHDLLILKLRSLHDIESQLVKALPKLAKTAHDERLREAFAAHAAQTEQHEERVDRMLEMLGDTAKGKNKVEAVRGLIADTDWIIKSVKNPRARDAVLIAAAQYIEHYEIAGYGTARTWAEIMGHDDVADLLQETLDEEGETNKKLTAIATNGINEKVETVMPV